MKKIFAKKMTLDIEPQKECNGISTHIAKSWNSISFIAPTAIKNETTGTYDRLQLLDEYDPSIVFEFYNAIIEPSLKYTIIYDKKQIAV